MTEFVQVTTATESRQEAEKLARSVVSARLAAGAQIVGQVISAFWHLGEFDTGKEWQFVFKTRADRYADRSPEAIENSAASRLRAMDGLHLRPEGRSTGQDQR
jgi:periplasmic divalent cation tolerance protein